MSEQVLAAAVVAWLQDMEWEVYQEVQMSSSSHRADIVAKRGPVVWAIETKMSASKKLAKQVLMWTHYANYVSVAVPERIRRYDFLFEYFAHREGIGIIEVSRDYGERNRVNEHQPPRLRRKVLPSLRDALREGHKTFAPAGNAEGLYYSPFKATCAEIRKVLQLSPGITMRECIESIQHHYLSAASARGAMAKWIMSGKVPGVAGRVEKGKLRLYPEGQGQHFAAKPEHGALGLDEQLEAEILAEREEER